MAIGFTLMSTAQVGLSGFAPPSRRFSAVVGCWDQGGLCRFQRRWQRPIPRHLYHAVPPPSARHLCPVATPPISRHLCYTVTPAISDHLCHAVPPAISVMLSTRHLCRAFTPAVSVIPHTGTDAGAEQGHRREQPALPDRWGLAARLLMVHLASLLPRASRLLGGVALSARCTGLALFEAQRGCFPCCKLMICVQPPARSDLADGLWKTPQLD